MGIVAATAAALVLAVLTVGVRSSVVRIKPVAALRYEQAASSL